VFAIVDFEGGYNVFIGIVEASCFEAFFLCL
jgi:hypothetical protein